MASVLHLYVSVKSECLDHAIVQVDFCQILTMEAWVLSQASTYDMWWTNCHASRFLSKHFGLLVSVIM